MRVRIGVDLVLVPHVREAWVRFGDRYLTRLFTENERAYCTDNLSRAGLSVDGQRETAAHAVSESQAVRTAERLAVRFAAKEAVFKLIRSPGGISWKDIEVGRDGELALFGQALSLAQARGLGPMSVSLSHEGDYATAVVAALEM